MMTATELKTQLVSDRTTELLAQKLAACTGSNEWPSIQNAAHAQALEEYEAKYPDAK